MSSKDTTSELRQALGITTDQYGVGHMVLDGNDIKLSAAMEIDLLQRVAAQKQRWVKTAEDKIYAEAEKVCPQHGNHLMTPVRSVQGVPTSYCEFSRVVPSALDGVIGDSVCPTCGGTGKIWKDEHSYKMNEERNFPCPTCQGGVIATPEKKQK
jgi:hypothetical protein